MNTLDRELTIRWTDPYEGSMRALELDGISWMRAMKAGELPPPPVASALGMDIESIEPGRIAFSMVPSEWMLNPTGVVHGGIIATLLDTVLTLCVITKLPVGKRATTVQLNVNYVRPTFANHGRIVAEGTALHIGTTIATSEARALDGRGKLVAHATTTLSILADAGPAATRSRAEP